MADQAGAYPGFCSMKRLGIFLLPPGWMLVHRMVTHSIKFAVSHLYNWVERGTVRVKCLAQELNVPARAIETRPRPDQTQTQTARCGVQRSNHGATGPQLNPNKTLT